MDNKIKEDSIYEADNAIFKYGGAKNLIDEVQSVLPQKNKYLMSQFEKLKSIKYYLIVL